MHAELDDILKPAQHNVQQSAPQTAELSVIVPTYNERGNVSELLKRLINVLEGTNWEVIFVDDDSSDGTLDELRALAQSDPRVRYLHRLNRRGLASAVTEGIQSTSSPFIAVIDADLQHDEQRLPEMLDQLKRTECDLVVGSRYVTSGGIGDWHKARAKLSQYGTWLTQKLTKTQLTDPLSG
ncbi:MAG: glycosyltransferase, partial [Hyphomicrobiaceae bacterium]